MAIPRSSADYYRRQQRILAALLLAIRRTWRRMDPQARWSEQYVEDGIGAQLTMLVTAAQVAAARDADLYIAAVLRELDLVPSAAPGVVIPKSLAGVTGAGLPVDSLLALAVPNAGRRFTELATASPASEPIERPDWVSDGLWESLERERNSRFESDIARNRESAARLALEGSGRWLEMAGATAVIDIARAAESAATTSYPQVTGYVRMLNPPSCSRCAVLAGRFYRWNTGFERHPRCDCRHIPSSEAIAGDMTVSPGGYFDSLPSAADLNERYPDLSVAMRREAGIYSQEDIFTKAGARAIRDGADMTQVVNARRGMQKAQVFGKDALITTEGTTRRGMAYRSLQRGDRTSDVLAPGERYRRTRSPRLMPESIYEHATSRDDAIRLLRAHGYIN